MQKYTEINEQKTAKHVVLHLVLVQLAVLVLLFALVLERDDDETDEDVDHEEGDDDDVDEEEDGDALSIVVYRAHVLLVRVDAPVHQTAFTVSTRLQLPPPM